MDTDDTVVRNVYAFLANAIVFVHFLYVTFVVAGELSIIIGWIFRWRWIRNMTFRISHLVATVIVAVQAVLDVACPLTVWENRLRELAGQTAEWNISFIGRLIREIIFYDFPDWFFMLLYVGFAVIVIVTAVFVPPRRKHRKQESRRDGSL